MRRKENEMHSDLFCQLLEAANVHMLVDGSEPFHSS